MTVTATIRRAAILISCPALVVGGLLFLRRRLVVVTVHGDSMLPSYHAGDRVLVRRCSLADIRAGEVVVLELPETGAWAIKRVAALPGDRDPEGVSPDAVLPPGRLYVLGDNPEISYDSRQAGDIRAENVLGVVTRRMRRIHGATRPRLSGRFNVRG